jgi:hypothetical protein
MDVTSTMEWDAAVGEEDELVVLWFGHGRVKEVKGGVDERDVPPFGWHNILDQMSFQGGIGCDPFGELGVYIDIVFFIEEFIPYHGLTEVPVGKEHQCDLLHNNSQSFFLPLCKVPPNDIRD